ncbi:hypothetical protein ACWC10_33680 [Streptomyces sp. NPDC001595]|uniref:hypothetical protein n=1 Tax=Streptomyces sp. NPDC001532 TaxID=3154520 RepID=UPI0033270D1D
MADEQYRWLDREMAERLLRGESPDAVDPAAREQADRLAEALGALSATPPLTSEEVPGEGAALAAFRKVRAERDEQRAALADPARERPADAGVFRIGGRADDRTTPGRRAGRHRPLRLALAAALAAGMVGGVAFAAGTGALPTPFDKAEPEPAASVSAAATPHRPQVTPSPEGTRGGAVASAPPDAGQPSRETFERTPGTGRDGEDREAAPSAGGAGRSWTEIASSCRAVRDGRGLDADRRRALEGVAGGSSRVGRYCETVLRGGTGGSGVEAGQGQGQNQGDEDNGGDDGRGHGGDGDSGSGGDGKGNGRGDNDDDGHGIARPGDGGHGRSEDRRPGSGAGDDRPGAADGGPGRAQRVDGAERQDRAAGSPVSPSPSLTPPYTTR